MRSALASLVERSISRVRRPALDQLLKDANRHRFDAVLRPAIIWPGALNTFCRCSMNSTSRGSSSSRTGRRSTRPDLWVGRSL
jgi:hypothetical protein